VDNTVFQSECQSILTRMINVVPNSVNLTDEITLLPAKVTYAQLTFEKNQFVFNTNFRLTQLINVTANANRNVTLYWCDRYGDNQNCTGKTNTALPVNVAAEDPGVSPITQSLGYYFINYNYAVPINTNASMAKFWFVVNEHNGSQPTTYNNGGSGYVIDQDQVLFVPMSSNMALIPNTTYTQTYTNGVGDGYTRHYSLVVAVRDGANPSRVYVDATDVAIQGFPFPLNMEVDFVANSSIPALAGYSFYTGTVDSSGVQMTMDVHAVTSSQTYTQTFVQTLQLDNAPYVQPGTVTVVTTTQNSAGSMVLPLFRMDAWHTLLVLAGASAYLGGCRTLLDLVL